MDSFLKDKVGKVLTSYGTRVMDIIKTGTKGKSLFKFFGDLKIFKLFLREVSSPTAPSAGEGGVVYVKDDGKPYFASSTTAETSIIGGGAEQIDELSDVDTSTVLPAINEVLKWNGTNWIPAIYNATFTFSVQYNRMTTPNHGSSTSVRVLIGDGQFQSSLVHSITYNNGGTFTVAPTMARAGHSPSGGVTGGYPLTTTSNGSVATSTAINYPASMPMSGGSYAYFRFTVTATFNGTTDNNGPHFYFYFRNKKFFGNQAASSLTSAQIISLGNEDWMSTPINGTDDYTQGSVSLNPTNEYVYYCYPSRITGTPVFKINGFGTGFTELTDVSVTNASGFVETYKVWQSPQLYNGSLSLEVL